MKRRRQRNLEDSIGSFLGLIIGLVVGLVRLVITAATAGGRRRSLLDKTNAAINQNVEQLTRRRAQLVRQDAYGKPVLDKWMEEINYFISRHIEPLLTIQEQAFLRRERAQVTQVIVQRIEVVTCNRPVFATFSENMEPTDFEVFCAEQLRQSGWDARVTQQSCDQGVDVVAEKNGLRIVLQCKLYSNPVGNKAVQEAVAAKAFERANHCAVVSNSSYTSAAEQLASTNAVFLLHYSDLRHLERLIREQDAPGAAVAARQDRLA